MHALVPGTFFEELLAPCRSAARKALRTPDKKSGTKTNHRDTSAAARAQAASRESALEALLHRWKVRRAPDPPAPMPIPPNLTLRNTVYRGAMIARWSVVPNSQLYQVQCRELAEPTLTADLCTGHPPRGRHPRPGPFQGLPRGQLPLGAHPRRRCQRPRSLERGHHQPDPLGQHPSGSGQPHPHRAPCQPEQDQAQRLPPREPRRHPCPFRRSQRRRSLVRPNHRPRLILTVRTQPALRRKPPKPCTTHPPDRSGGWVLFWPFLRVLNDNWN